MLSQFPSKQTMMHAVLVIHESIAHPNNQYHSATLGGTARRENNSVKMSSSTTTNNNKPIQRPNEALIDTIETERKLSQKFRIETERKWKVILSHEKVDALKSHADELKSRYKQELSKKEDLVVQNLSKLRLQGEDQRRTAVATHLQTIDDMIRNHVNQLLMMEKIFHDNVSQIRLRVNIGRRESVQKHDLEMNALAQEKKHAELEAKRMAQKDARDQQQELEEIRNKNLEDINSLRFILNAKIEDLDDQFDLAKNEYLQKTDSQSENLQKQLARGDEMSGEAMTLQQNIDKLYLATKKIKRISNRKTMQNKDRCDQLMRRKVETVARHKSTKEKMEDLRLMQHEKLKELTMRASRQKKCLEDELFYSEKILKIVRMVSKLEQKNGLGIVKGEVSSKTSASIGIEAILERYNQILLHYTQIQEKETNVREKNILLKGNIEIFMNGITVNDDVMFSNNPLFVVNGKMHLHGNTNTNILPP